MRRPTGILFALVAPALAGAACSDTTIESGDASADLPYAEAMAAVCTRTEADLAELPEPPDAITVADFSAEVARILSGEADAARRLDAPDELAADHRAFVSNTDEHAAGWRRLAEAGDSSIGDEMTRIAELTLGRDDLATEMGIPDCRRES